MMDDMGWRALGNRLTGDVILPGDERMVLANKQYAAGRPLPEAKALLRCRDLDDVRRSLDFVRTHAIPFSVRSGGHCFADFSSCDGAVIDLGEMHDCRAQGDLIRVGPGLFAGDLVSALANVGRAFPTGGCPWVAIGGLSLVGGFGFLGRSTGLVVDQVRTIEVLTADGNVVECSADAHSDLFWAMRGAGAGGFGIATALQLPTFAFPAFMICYGVWPMSEAVALIEWWQTYAAKADPHVNIELGLIGSDHLDDPLFVKLYGVIIGTERETESDAKRLRASLGGLAAGLRTWTPDTKTAAGYLAGLIDHQGKVAWQPSRPYQRCGYQFTRSDFFEQDFSRQAIEDCVRQFEHDRRYAQMRELEFIPWGAAYATADAASCFMHRAPQMMVRHVAMLGARADDALREHARSWVDDSQASLAAHANGHVYQGYADSRLPNWQYAYYGDTYPRLQQIKRRYDPDNLFRHPQSIEPAIA